MVILLTSTSFPSASSFVDIRIPALRRAENIVPVPAILDRRCDQVHQLDIKQNIVNKRNDTRLL